MARPRRRRDAARRRTAGALHAAHPDHAGRAPGGPGEIRRRGYSTDNEEHELGVACVATPVLDRAGRPLAAISISGPISRILNPETAELAGLLRGHGEAVGASLG